MHGESEQGGEKIPYIPGLHFLVSGLFNRLFCRTIETKVKPLVGIFIHEKEETPGSLQEFLDQTGVKYRTCSTCETGEIPKVHLSHLLILERKNECK